MKYCNHPSILFAPQHSTVELNFRKHFFENDSLIFLNKGEVLNCNDFNRLVTISQTNNLSDYRYLFSPVLSIGHVDVVEKIDDHSEVELLDTAKNRWIQLNPFKMTEEEMELLFNVNDWLNENLQADLVLRNDFLSFAEIQKLSKRKLNLTFFQWKNRKLVESAKKKLYANGGSIKETTYDLGFKDSSYFSRFFKRITQKSPREFLQSIEQNNKHKNLLLEFQKLLEEHFRVHHQVSFYSEKLNLTSGTFRRNIYAATSMTPKEIINSKIIAEAKKLLLQVSNVSEIAYVLGFEELSHFSSFFKHQTQISPSEYQTKSTAF